MVLPPLGSSMAHCVYTPVYLAALWYAYRSPSGSTPISNPHMDVHPFENNSKKEADNGGLPLTTDPIYEHHIIVNYSSILKVSPVQISAHKD